MLDLETAKAINAVSLKVNDLAAKLDSYFGIKANENKESAADAQNATCELGLEMDERISDIENALCELSEVE